MEWSNAAADVADDDADDDAAAVNNAVKDITYDGAGVNPEPCNVLSHHIILRSLVSDLEKKFDLWIFGKFKKSLEFALPLEWH